MVREHLTQRQVWGHALDLEFDEHALDQMAGRQIPERAVYDVIGDHDQRIDRDDGVTEYHGTWDGRQFLVVVRWADDDESHGLVITAINSSRRQQKRRR
jgi:hypothetical protein